MARRKSDSVALPGDARWNSPLVPAPGDLRIVQAFVNTANPVQGTDELANPVALGNWLARWDLAEAGAVSGDMEVARAIEVRTALQALFRGHRGGTPADEDTIARLDRTAFTATLRVRFETADLVRSEPAVAGFEGALARLFEIVVRARTEGLWQHLKLCADPDCNQTFFDISPNRTGKWCRKRCGNRVNARSSRRRRGQRK